MFGWQLELSGIHDPLLPQYLMRFRALNRLHGVLGGVRLLVAFVAATFGAVLKASAADISSRFGESPGRLVLWMQDATWWIVPLAVLAIPALDWSRRTIGNPQVWGVIRDVLDQFRQQLFRENVDDQVHEHRVTLFRYSRWRWCTRKWPWAGWLVPVERSGHTTQRTNIAFLAPDDADRAEGVAGVTWSRRQVVSVSNLPDLTTDFSGQSVTEYSRNSFMPEAMVRTRKPRARSLVGIPVEVRNQLWGVIVIDSRRPEIKQAEVKKYYKLVVRFLGKTLEGL